MPTILPTGSHDRQSRVCSKRGVVWDSHESAWVASMKRRGILLREVFSVSQYGEDVSLALAIIRRTQMEIFWRSTVNSSTSPFSSIHACQRVVTKQKLQNVACGKLVEENVCETMDQGLFFDSCAQAWVVRWMTQGRPKRKHFRASAPDSFIKAFEFNDNLRRMISP